jgi:hypothetical protein
MKPQHEFIVFAAPRDCYGSLSLPFFISCRAINRVTDCSMQRFSAAISTTLPAASPSTL